MAISLIDAIRQGDVDLARKILNNRKYKEIDGQTARKDGTALYWACCLGMLDIVHLLIIHGADVNAPTGWRSTPLHAASDNNHSEVVRLLIKCGANVNDRTKTGDTPCHLASYRGYAEIVQILIENGASIEIVNNKYRTSLEEAQNKGHTKIVKYLSAVREIVTENSKYSNMKNMEENVTLQASYFPSLQDLRKVKALHDSNNVNNGEAPWGRAHRTCSCNLSYGHRECTGNDLSVTSNRNYHSRMSYKNI